MHINDLLQFQDATAEHDLLPKIMDKLLHNARYGLFSCNDPCLCNYRCHAGAKPLTKVTAMGKVSRQAFAKAMQQHEDGADTSDSGSDN